jgi:hypothetical protein
MKRLVQFAAVALVGLVGAQPALAGLLCAAPAAACPMAMTDMGPDCPMSGAMAAAECPLTAYLHAIPQSVASVAATGRPKAEPPASAHGAAPVMPLAHRTLVALNATAAEASSPPLYILHRVFRI